MIDPGPRQQLSAWLRAAMEGVVLLLVVLLPWGPGLLSALFEQALFTGVAVLLVLWAARMLLEGRPIWTSCPLTLCLAGVFLLGVWQILPLPRAVLTAVSPKTAELNARLLPQAAQERPSGEFLEGGSAISLSPAGTQAFLLQLLAVIALFAAVRSNVASPASFRRLSVVALINGFLMALVGLLQFFSSPRNVVYWTIPTQTAVFGPFNRNDFACYINVCIGLGVGVLLAGRMSTARRSRDDTTSLWVGAALVLMLTALALCLSRGGLLSMLAAVAIVAAVARPGAAGWSRFGPIGVLLCLALGLAAWFGLDETQGRLAMLLKDDGARGGRWEIWVQTAPFVSEFPLWGAGFTTFPFLERMSRGPGMGIDFIFENAHNEYLNLLLEGGAVGLMLGLAALGLAWSRGVRGCRQYREQPAGGIALGGLIALTAVALHSLVDYGLHLPAIAALVSVLAAQLAAVGDDKGAEQAGRWSFVPGAAVALLGTAGAVAIAWVLTIEGHTRVQAERYSLAARSLESSVDWSARQRRIAYLGAAANLTPTDADRQQALADALYTAFRSERNAIHQQVPVAEPAGFVLVGANPFDVVVHAAVRSALLDREERRLEDEYLRPALTRYVKARGLCPLLPRPHVCLAAHAATEMSGEPASVHLDRARLLIPYNATIWFLSGSQALQEGHRERAWQYWRRCLEYSGEHLEEILARSRKHLRPEAMAASILPDDPELLYRAALVLAPEGENVQRPLLRRAVELLHERPGEPKADVLLLEARSLVRLGQAEEALRAFERLSGRSPSNVDWRYEFAQVLHEQGRLDEARRELRTLLQQQPDHARGKDLYREVLRRQGEGH